MKYDYYSNISIVPSFKKRDCTELQNEISKISLLTKTPTALLRSRCQYGSKSYRRKFGGIQN